jgi:transposase InsO family protein
VAGEVFALPWKETSPVKQRKEFIDACIAEEGSMAELCRRFSVSRKTGYKWLSRFMGGCELVDRSRRPKTTPKAVSEALEEAIVGSRKLRPTWGPRKLRAALQRANPGVELPSVTTFALIFKRNGLIVPRRRKRRTTPSTLPLAHATAPNKLWCIDFKGDFVVGNARCYPLTITDAFSRYLLACVALPNTRGTGVRRAMREVFEAYGLPDAIRSDNGSPFASRAPCGLSEVSIWWWRLGIRHERIEPGKPQQNGRHERMHLTLKRETAAPPERSKRAQQRAFDHFRAEYNEVRPHEALDNAVPADFYERSLRTMPEPYWGREFVYPEDYEVVDVRKSGCFYWNERSVMVSAALSHQRLGLSWREGDWDVFFGPLRIGVLTRGRGGRAKFVRIEDVSPMSVNKVPPMSVE